MSRLTIRVSTVGCGAWLRKPKCPLRHKELSPFRFVTSQEVTRGLICNRLHPRGPVGEGPSTRALHAHPSPDRHPYRRALCAHPLFCSVAEALVLPDRHLVLEVVDQA